MLETVGATNEDANEDCIDEAAQLAEMNKKRMGIQDRLQLLDAITQMIEGFLGAFADFDASEREEHGVAELFENFYGSMFTIITESIEGINKDGVAGQAKEQLQQQLCMVLRLIDTLMAVSFENDKETALQYFLPFAGTLFELCCSQLCLGSQYDFFVRQMSLGLLTDQIEAKTLNPFLRDPANKAIVELIIDTCFKLCADEKDAAREAAAAAGEQEEDEDDEEEEGGMKLDPSEESSQNLGTQLLDTLTSCLLTEAGESIAAPIILARSTSVLSQAGATPLDTKAALICLAVLPEAANSFAKTSDYLTAVMAFLQSFSAAPHDAVVRSGAYIALSEHLEHLKPEIAQFHPAVLANIVATLADANEASPYTVKTKACLPLAILVKSSESLPLEYLQPTSSQNLVRFLLDQIKPFSTKAVEELTKDDFELLGELITCVRDFAVSYSSAVEEKSVPEGASEYFVPFVNEAFELLLAVSQRSTSTEAWVVRGQAAASSALVAANMSLEVLLEKMPTLSALLTASMEAEPDVAEDETLPDDVFTVRQSMHATWSALAQKLKGQIEPFVDAQVPFICRALADGYGANDEEEPDEDNEEMPQPTENQPRDQERAFAVECYRDFVNALGPKFLPFQERCFAVLNENYTTYAPEVMAEVVQTIKLLPSALYPTESAAAVPTAGVDLALPEKLAELLKAVKSMLLDYIQHATDAEIVETALDAFSELIDQYGQVVVNDDAATMVAFEKITKSLLKSQAPCQTIDPNEIPYIDTENGFGAEGFGGFGGFGGEDGEDEEDEEDQEEDDDEEEEEEHVHGENCHHGDDGHSHGPQNNDVLLIESLFAALGSLAKAKGPSFKSTLDAVWPRVLKLRSKPQYAGAISGFFADIGEAISDDLFADYRAQIFPFLLADLSPESTPAVWRNTSYALGQLFLKCDVDATKQFYEQAVTSMQAAITALNLLIDASDDKTSSYCQDLFGAKDNVIAALGRMLMVGAEHLPRATLVPIFVAGLPLQNDFGENQQAYAAVAKLVSTLPSLEAGVIEPLYPQLLRVFGTVLSQGDDEKVSEKLKGFIVKTARTILAAQPNLRAEVVDQIEESLKAEFVKRLDAAEE